MQYNQILLLVWQNLIVLVYLWRVKFIPQFLIYFMSDVKSSLVHPLWQILRVLSQYTGHLFCCIATTHTRAHTHTHTCTHSAWNKKKYMLKHSIRPNLILVRHLYTLFCPGNYRYNVKVLYSSRILKQLVGHYVQAIPKMVRPLLVRKCLMSDRYFKHCTHTRTHTHTHTHTHTCAHIHTQIESM